MTPEALTDPPRIAVTMGDVNGVGPEILAKAFASPALHRVATPIVLGCIHAYDHARGICGGVDAREVATGSTPVSANALAFLDGVAKAPAREPGVLRADAGRAAMRWFEQAIDLVRSGVCDAVVTCPIHKQGIHAAGYTCRGHTDFLADRIGADTYWMCLWARGVLVVHVSDHVSLRQALSEVDRPRIEASIRTAHEALQRLGGRGRIAVAGLNPHAGEAGAFGDEELRVIAPAIETCAAEGIACTGPHSPDAVFRHALEGRHDAVVAMYHDQGHIPMKLVAMDDGVNVTLGLPVIRTSVDHGTAYDIAGTGQVREHSFVEAYKLAARLAAVERGNA